MCLDNPWLREGAEKVPERIDTVLPTQRLLDADERPDGQ